MSWEQLIDRAAAVGARLKERNETVAVAESSAGGLISAALLAVPGASAYFVAGGVVYTGASKQTLMGVSDAAMAEGKRRDGNARSAPGGCGESPAAERLGHWRDRRSGAERQSLRGSARPFVCRRRGAETTVVPRRRAATVETGSADRAANMIAFAVAALDLLAACVSDRE